MQYQQYLELLGLASKVADQIISNPETPSELKAELTKFKDSLAHMAEMLFTNGKPKITSEEYENSGPFKIIDYSNLTGGSSV